MSLLARLIEAGTPADLIEEVAMMVAEKRASERALEEARAKSRERQARKRERDLSRDVTDCHVTDCDIENRGLSRPPNENISNPPTHTPDKLTPARKGLDFPRLDCADPATWADFLKNRKTKRLPNTPSAHGKLVSDLAALSARTGWPPGRVFAACVAQGWGAIYETDEMKAPTNGKRNSFNREPLVDIARTVAADMEREAAARAGY